MLGLLETFFQQFGYFAVFWVLVLCGFGIPIPEDVTLVAGGVISGLGYTNVHIMFAVGMAGVLVGDGLMFLLGRHYGERILRSKIGARLMPRVVCGAIPARPAQSHFPYRRYERPHFLLAVAANGRLCRADFRAALDLFGQHRRRKQRLADVAGAPFPARVVRRVGRGGRVFDMAFLAQTRPVAGTQTRIAGKATPT